MLQNESENFMKKRDLYRKSAIFLFALGLLLCMTQTAQAGGTAAGTSIASKATISFKVNTIQQTDIESSPSGNSTPGSGNGTYTTFLVDNKIDLTVTTIDTLPITVYPGGVSYVLSFRVSNDGNKTQDYGLSAITISTGNSTKFNSETDDFDMTNVNVYADKNGNGVYDSGTDTDTFIDELAADANVAVFILADSPLTAANLEYSSYHLLVQAKDGGASGSEGAVTTETAGADNPEAEDIVFADGQGTDTANDAARDGKYSDQDDYKCLAAVLTITKTSAVISDPVNGITNPKRIPGAIIEYTVTVENAAGAATATDIEVSDSLDTEITAGTISFKTDGYDTLKGIQVTAPNLYSGVATALTNAGDTDEGDFDITSANSVTVTGIALNGGESATVKFKVEVTAN